ncbi:DNA cytosine methyltransferase [Hymenobacter properus]
MGWATAVMVEWDDFARQVLIKNFKCVPAESLSAAELVAIIGRWKAWTPGQPHPPTILYGDICHFDARPWLGAIDLVCGGFPCQPFSLAGKQLGNDDPRALWPHFLRIIREVQPSHVLGENVRGLLSNGRGLAFEGVCVDLETEGYEVQPFLLPAASVGAPHHRDRFWFVAHANSGQRLRQEFQVRTGWDATGLLCEAVANAGCLTGDRRQTDKSRCGFGFGHDSRWQETANQLAGPAPEDAADAHGERQQQPEGLIEESGRRADNSREEYATHALCTGCQECNVSRVAGDAGHVAGGNPSADGWRLTEPPLCSPDDGVPARLVRTAADKRAAKRLARRIKKLATAERNGSLKSYGNAVVPQLVHRFYQAIAATA